MTVTSTRNALATALNAIDGLHASATIPPNVDPDFAFVGAPTIAYDDDFEGDPRYTFPITVVVPPELLDVAQEKLDEYLTPTGPKSIPAAINAVPMARAVNAEGYGALYSFGEREFPGVTINVQVLG